MSCNSRRRKLWKALEVNAEEIEALFRDAQKTAQVRSDITPAELEEWANKTRCVLDLFDQHEIPRPVHSQKRDLPKRSATAGYATVWDAVLAGMFNKEPGLPRRESTWLPGEITKDEIFGALHRLGQLAQAQGRELRLLLLGGAAMVLAYGARRSTHDVDAISLTPDETGLIRDLAKTIAREQGWSTDWLNDAAKGYVVGVSIGPRVFSAPGIDVFMPSPHQLLAMKLSAWRDDLDIADAQRLIQEIGNSVGREAVWNQIERYLVPGRELKAQYAFADLWTQFYGDD